jgi:hypothetical protein
MFLFWTKRTENSVKYIVLSCKHRSTFKKFQPILLIDIQKNPDAGANNLSPKEVLSSLTGRISRVLACTCSNFRNCFPTLYNGACSAS